MESGNNGFGIVFLMMGISLLITNLVAFGWQFALTGLPFLILGIVFMPGNGRNATEGEQDS